MELMEGEKGRGEDERRTFGEVAMEGERERERRGGDEGRAPMERVKRGENEQRVRRDEGPEERERVTIIFLVLELLQ